MTLKSRLFRGDDRLEACLISDPAHLTPGTVGNGVSKVQRALSIVDGAVIDAREMRAKIYGPSTTAAVVRYKKARDIINRTYEKAVDNIVGKMTIKSLDDEMSRLEGNIRLSASCCDPGPAGDGRRRQTTQAKAKTITSANPSASGLVGFSGRITTQINLAFQMTKAGSLASGEQLADQVTAANELTEEILIFDSPSLRDHKTFDFTMDLESKDDPEIHALHQQASKILPLGRHQLRVIVHAFRPNSLEFGFTKSGFLDGTFVHPFIVLNARRQREDNLTLLHEIIHAAGIPGPHDSEASEPGSFSDDTSVFSYGGPSNKTRDHIRAVHLNAIRRAPFAEPFQD